MAWSWLDAWWRKPALKITDPENSRRGKGGTWSGHEIGPAAAMQLSAWWSCVRLIAETVATLPLQVFERAADGSKRVLADHSLYSLLHDSPNADQTSVEYLEGAILSICNFGDAFALKDKRGDGSIISLEPLSAAPGDMEVRRDSRGVIRYSFQHRGRRFVDMTEDDVFHIRGFGAGGERGLSPLSYARHSLGIAYAIGSTVGGTFQKGMKSSIFFTAPPGVKMNREQRQEFRETFIEPYVGGESTNAGILEGGFDVKAVSLPPKDAEMLLNWRFSVEDICRWLRVPPVLIGHAGEGQTMWGSGIEQIMLGWLTLGLRPYLTRFEQAAKKRLIVPKERGRVFVEFNVEGLLRADSAGRAAMLSSLGQNGYLTRNEGRAMDNRPPLPGGDDLTVQSNMIPLSQLGDARNSLAAAEQARNAFRNWLIGGDRQQQQQRVE